MTGKFVKNMLTWATLVLLLTLALQGAETPSVNVPRLISFNGTLKDQKGHPLNGVVGLRFALYKDQANGTPLWVEVQNAQFDDQGRYSVLLGAYTGDGLPTDLFTSGESRWLGVQPLIPGEEEQSRVLLVSVPYALKAADADTVGGKPASAFVLADTESVKSGISNGSNGPVVSGISGTGTTGRFAKWIDGPGGVLGDAGTVIAENLGNFGIGSASPLEKLEVNGNLRLAGQNTHVIQIQGASSSGRLGQDAEGFFFASDTTGKALKFLTNNGNLNESLRIASTGYVGIGTSSPAAPLHVEGTNSGILLAGGGAHSISVQGTGSSGRLGQDATGFFFASDTAGKALSFYTNDGSLTEKVRVDSTGNMGIGTSTPTARLDVSGTIKGTAFSGNGAALTNVPVTDGSVTTLKIADSAVNSLKIADGAIMDVDINAGAAISASKLSTAARTRAITYLGGCDTCSVLADTDDQKTIYFNVVGPMTFASVTCFADAGTPVINIQRDNGSTANILNSDLTCNGTSTSSFAISTLNASEKLDFVMVTAGGVAKRVTVSIQAVVN